MNRLLRLCAREEECYQDGSLTAELEVASDAPPVVLDHPVSDDWDYRKLLSEETRRALNGLV